MGVNSKKSRNENKSACVDCHFLVELIYYDIPDDMDSTDPSHYGRVEEKRHEIDSNNRGKIKKNDYSWFKGGIDDFRLHDLRHTFATRLAQAGVDIYKISKLLGHKDIKMTQRYAHHCPDSLRDGVEVLESDYNLTTVEKKEYSETL